MIFLFIFEKKSKVIWKKLYNCFTYTKYIKENFKATSDALIPSIPIKSEIKFHSILSWNSKF